MDHLPAHIRKKYASIPGNDFRIAQVQELAGNDDAAAARLGLNLHIDLKWVRAIEHLSRSGAG